MVMRFEGRASPKPKKCPRSRWTGIWYKLATLFRYGFLLRSRALAASPKEARCLAGPPVFGKNSAKCCSFSAVSAPIFARKYAFCSIFQNLPDYLAAIFEIWQKFNKNCKFCNICNIFAEFSQKLLIFKPIFCENFEIAVVQKYAILVELEKCCQTHIFLQNFVLIQPRTSCIKTN